MSRLVFDEVFFEWLLLTKLRGVHYNNIIIGEQRRLYFLIYAFYIILYMY